MAYNGFGLCIHYYKRHLYLNIESAFRFQNNAIVPKIFAMALREWRRYNFDCLKLVDKNLFQCPACSDGYHAVHTDGNKKVYRYSRNNQ